MHLILVISFDRMSRGSILATLIFIIPIFKLFDLNILPKIYPCDFYSFFFFNGKYDFILFRPSRARTSRIQVDTSFIQI